jgi:hypothetical protein
MMATNVYFSPAVKSEQNLYEDIVIESLKMYGQDVYYLPRNIVERDYILGETVESQFDDSYTLEMYIENPEGFGGESELMTKFGLEIRDTATFVVSKRRWEQSVGVFNNELTNYRPNEGDLIYLPMSKSFFQIDKVEHEKPFYQLQNLPTYQLICSLYEFGDEKFDTGNTEVDNISNLFAYQQELTISGIAGTDFIIGENITENLGDGVTISGAIASYKDIADSTTSKIYLHSIRTSDSKYHQFTVGGSVTTEVSSGTGTITAIKDMEGATEASVQDNYAKNYEIETEAAAVLDFTESNPFGDF